MRLPSIRGRRRGGLQGIKVEIEGENVEIAGAFCCLCQKGIIETKIDPITLDITANDEDISQLLWCHAACLRATGASGLREELFENTSQLGSSST